MRRGRAGDDLAQIVGHRVVVLEALRQLPARQREAVILRAVAGLSEAAIAQAMGVSVGSVKRYASERAGKGSAFCSQNSGGGKKGTADDQGRGTGRDLGHALRRTR